MADPFAPGHVLRGKYRIDRVIGRGGMGLVLEGFHLDLERRVAIKALLPELREHAEIVERFFREGKAASRLEGDNVVRILDVDRLDDGTPFLVMEHLEGADLSSVRRAGVPLPMRDAVEHVLQACTALAQAHSRGVVHRDVKPANLFLARARDGSLQVKVLDFGISKLASALPGEPSTTTSTTVMGSAEYMSPEQMLSSRDVDGRTDVWALGVTLFELLTARVPFPGVTVTEVCAQVMTQPPPDPRSFRAEIPERVSHVLLGCLEKDAQRRFASVEAFAAALRAALPAVGPETMSEPAPAAPATGAHGPRTSLLAESHAPPARSAIAAAPNASGSGTALSAPDLAPYRGTSTHVAVSSEPIPAPPRRSALPAVIGVLALVAMSALALGIRTFSVTASEPPPPPGGASRLEVHAPALAGGATVVAPDPSDGQAVRVTPEVAAPISPQASASAASPRGSSAAGASKSRRAPVTGATTSPHAPSTPAQPVPVSGID